MDVLNKLYFETLVGKQIFSEVLIFLDPRFPGGTTSAVLAEITALSKIGITPGLCMVRGPVMSGWRDYHRGVVEVLESGKARLMDVKEPCRCNVALIHHPMLFHHMPAYPIDFQAEHLLLVLQHPPLSGSGASEYDLRGIMRNIEACLGRAAMLAPVGPAVRKQLDGLIEKEKVLPFDWHNLVDDELWRQRLARPKNDRIIIGRHSRPEGRKYPLELETALDAYPTAPRFEVRMLGADASTLEKRWGQVPHEWTLEPFREGGVHPFLEELDYWVFHHGPEWIEAFGIAIVEAILTGVPAILPPHFKPLFQEAALYGDPIETLEIIDQLEAEPAAYEAHVNKARTLALSRFGQGAEASRFNKISPLWSKRPKNLPSSSGTKTVDKRRILMMTSNGVGLGHMTRLLAIADRLGSDVEIAFLTMSQAFHLIEERGILTQFLPFHRLTHADNKNWNRSLTEEISDMMQFFRPDMLIFDGNVPYGGLVSALQRHPDVMSIWIRRAMWAGDKSSLLKRSSSFDTVIEPGEIAARFDDGPTARLRNDTYLVDPVLLVSPKDRLSREDARRELGIKEDETAVGLMLGAGTNFTFDDIREAFIADLKNRTGVRLIELVSPVRPIGNDTDLEQLVAYPSYRVSQAFDFMISSAGYNSFHEAILGAIPTLFVPNQAQEMDRQDIRAVVAKSSGWGEMLTRVELIGVKAAVDTMLEFDRRAEMQRRMRRVNAKDGADQIASFVKRQLDFLPAHRPMFLPR